MAPVALFINNFFTFQVYLADNDKGFNCLETALRDLPTFCISGKTFAHIINV